jgi:pimeloyl-ACP methyl ester carboxylesterase
MTSMRSIIRRAAADTAAATRMVWLPGAYHSAQHFLDAGFPEAVRRRRIPLDLVFVDVEMQHLNDREALGRLRSEILVPGLQSGAAVWLAGISLGGMMALDIASSGSEEFEGLCLLAPYLGNRMLLNEIDAAGGLGVWEPGELAEADTERRIWRYLKSTGRRALHLGYGRQDRFASAHALLARELPPDAVDAVEGGHEWDAWARLWENFLDSRFT